VASERGARETTAGAERARLPARGSLTWRIAAIALGLLIAGGLAVVDAASSPNDDILITTVVLAPLVVSVLGGPRETALVAAVAFIVVVVSGFWNHNFSTHSYYLRVGVVLAAGAVSVLGAAGRERIAGYEYVGGFGPMLGVFPDATWQPTPVPVRPGDILVFYSDGVVDATGDQDRFGHKRLQDVVAPATGAADAVARVRRALADFEVGPQADDTAVLVVERIGAAETAVLPPAARPPDRGVRPSAPRVI
jgi:hypothetical protein